jgi:hypothetical protein
MPRALPSAALAELYAQRSSGVWLTLLTIEHADLPATIRLVNDRASVVSGGDTYAALGFSIQLPADAEEIPRASLTVDAVDRTIITALRSITTPATVTVEIVRQSAPDTILASWVLEMRNASYDAQTVTMELYPPPVLDEAYPGTDFTPLLFPGIFDR